MSVRIKQILLFIFLILVLNQVSAIEVVEIEGSDYYDTGTIDERDIAIIQRMASLENKMDNLASKQDLTTSTKFIYDELYKQFRDKTDFMVLATVFINLFIVGFAFAIYLILKSRRRL